MTPDAIDDALAEMLNCQALEYEPDKATDYAASKAPEGATRVVVEMGALPTYKDIVWLLGGILAGAGEVLPGTAAGVVRAWIARDTLAE